jgi:hypothetical protein
MSDIKEKIITAIRQLPADASYEDIMEIVLVQEKVARGLKQVDEGQGIPDEEMEKEFSQRQAKRRKSSK